MIDINGDVMSGEMGIQKPRGNILTEPLRITISISEDARHVPQCRNQTNELMKRSFSLDVTEPLHVFIESIILIG